MHLIVSARTLFFPLNMNKRHWLIELMLSCLNQDLQVLAPDLIGDAQPTGVVRFDTHTTPWGYIKIKEVTWVKWGIPSVVKISA